MGKSTISMAILKNYVSLPEGIPHFQTQKKQRLKPVQNLFWPSPRPPGFSPPTSILKCPYPAGGSGPRAYLCSWRQPIWDLARSVRWCNRATRQCLVSKVTSQPLLSGAPGNRVHREPVSTPQVLQTKSPKNSLCWQLSVSCGFAH